MNYEPPYIVIPMPLNEKGEGPALEAETVRTVFQVWDSCFMTVSEHETETEAIAALPKLEKA